MTRPETTISLAVDIHRQTQQNNESRNPSKRSKHLHRSTRYDPVVHVVAHAVEEEVLECHGHDEDFVGKIAEPIEDVGARRDGTDEDTKEHDCVDDGRKRRIPVLLETVSVQSETEDGEDETEDHGEKTELRLIDTLVSLDAEFDDGIGGDGHEDGSAETTDGRSNGEISDVGSRVEVWWWGEPLSHDEGDTDVPSDNQPRHDDNPQGSDVEECEEGSNDETEEVIFVVDATGRSKSFCERLSFSGDSASRLGGANACSGFIAVLASTVGALLDTFRFEAKSLLESSQLFKVLVDVGIEIVERVSVVAGFGAEEDHENPLDTAEGKEDPETIFPAEIGGNRSSDDGNQVGDGTEDKIE